ncbi:MAG: HNH endonuclease [Syntrophorhabdaceae bacterium]|nr:HNH endonuclease [Syntrophorhabdaceae bacterium]MDD5242934.1 HNH endonuclease [Syntrophorhabdaceae bacterium]
MIKGIKLRRLGYRTKKELNKLTAKTIGGEISAMEIEVEHCKAMLDKAGGIRETDRRRSVALEARAGDLLRQIAEIRKSDQSYERHLLGLGKRKMSASAARRIEEIEHAIERKKEEIALILPYRCETKDLRPVSYYESTIKVFEQAIKRYRTYLSTKQKKENRVATWRALAARKTGTSRDIAASVKRQLSTYKYCPYCGGPLGTEPHADHIYPIAKGGLSLDSNMVIVCKECNLKKKDMTLGAFMRKYKLDPEKIKQALLILKKDF